MPRLAVNMMVLNGAAVLRRCLLPFKGVLDELVVVDTGSTDDTLEVLIEIAAEVGATLRLIPLDPTLGRRPSADFFTDEASTWRHPMPGPFTGRRICNDWARARNLALDATAADYVVKLDADDEPLSPPENWLRTADYLDARPEIDVVSAPYEIYDGHGKLHWLSMYDRMFRRRGAHWVMPFHEYLRGKGGHNTLYSVQGLRVRDWRDSPGDGVRVAHRNLKVLLWNWENVERKTVSSPDDLRDDLVERFTLAHEAADVLPEFALGLLDQVEARLDPADRAMLSDCRYHKGRAREALGDVHGAVSWYVLACEASASVQALLKLYVLCENSPDLVPGLPPGYRDLRAKILAMTGSEPTDPTPFNCDLGLVARVREHG